MHNDRMKFYRPPKPFAPPIFHPQQIQGNYFKLCETPQKITLERGGGVSSGKFLYVMVGCAIPSWKGACSHTILVKGGFNYCHPCNNVGTLNIMSLHPYPRSEDHQIFFKITHDIRYKKV